MQQPIGSYLLLEKIASSPVSEVFLAKSTDPVHLGRVVALKRLRRDLGLDPSFITLFVQQARQTVALLHDNIVRTFELGCRGCDYYTTMEYVSGLSLATVLQRVRYLGLAVSEHAVLLLGVQICDALAYAHAQTPAMVHRDICPGNILLAFCGQAKVLNFGLAPAATLVARARDVFFRGHYSYLAPEQVRGGQLDGRADLFSLAVVLHELLTLKPMFAGRSDRTVVAKLRAAAAPGAAAGLAPDVQAILQRALQPLPQDRYPHARAMREALRNVLHQRYAGGDPQLLTRLMCDLFPRDVQREAALWKTLVRSGWVPPQATAILRWLRHGLPGLRAPLVGGVPRRARPPVAAHRGSALVWVAGALACGMVALTYVLTHAACP